MLPGSSRQRLAHTLKAAYAEGVLSENTLVHRLDLLFDSPLVDPAGLVGDLQARRRRRPLSGAVERTKATGRRFWEAYGIGGLHEIGRYSSPALLALDWEGGHEELVIGRNPTCDIVLAHPAVSRIHARLSFRGGSWILQDLGSTNGTLVNGSQVGRCKLRPGDRVVIGDEQLLVD